MGLVPRPLTIATPTFNKSNPEKKSVPDPTDPYSQEITIVEYLFKMARDQDQALSASSLVPLMAASLPKDARPQLKSPYDAVALFAHACMTSVGFRLLGLGEDHKIEPGEQPSPNEALPTDWNANSSYAFRYAHSQSSMEYLIKVNRLGGKAVIFGIGMGDDKTTSFDIPVKDFLSESSFPYELPTGEQSAEQTQKSIQDLFISPARISDLSSLFKLNILQKLMPGLHKEGYEDSSRSATAAQSSSSSTRREERQQPPRRGNEEPQHDPLRDDRLPAPARPYPFDDPLAAAPRRPYPVGDFPPPGFEDEYEINRPARGGIGGRSPLNIGERDLYPPGLGPHDPLRPSFGPGAGAGGGMHPTFDDPLFAGRRGQGGYDPSAPLGARYDPVGPGDQPYDPYGIPRFPGGGSGRPPNPFGGFGDGDFI